jgi:hypothetical protein
MVTGIRSAMLRIQKKIQNPLSSFIWFIQNRERSINSFHPITPVIMMNGMIGRINLSCLFGKYEWKMKKIATGTKISRYFFQVLRNPKKSIRLTGGISNPKSAKK